jgi:plastocyanin
MRDAILLPTLALCCLVGSGAVAAHAIHRNGFEVPSCTGSVTLAGTMTPAARSTTLGTETVFHLALRSCGYSGTVSVALTGVPASWNAAVDPAAFVIAAGESRTLPLRVTVPGTGSAGPAVIGVEVSTNAGIDVVLAAELDVVDEYIVRIALGAGSAAHGFPASIQLRAGATLRVFNADTTPHRMHFDGSLPHQAVDMGFGDSYSVTPMEPGSQHVFYCHSHGTGTGQTTVNVQ